MLEVLQCILELTEMFLLVVTVSSAEVEVVQPAAVYIIHNYNIQFILKT